MTTTTMRPVGQAGMLSLIVLAKLALYVAVFLAAVALTRA
jgi:hypothetical protein